MIGLMSENVQIVILVGLAFNFITMLIGGLSLLFGIFKFALRNDRRMTRLESDVRQLMMAQGIKPRQEIEL